MNKSKQLVKKINQINSLLFLATVFLVPIFFNPLSANLFVLSKNTLLAIVSSILLILWMTKNILSKSFRITLSPFTLPLFLLATLSLISSYSTIPQFVESFINYTATPAFLFLVFLIATTTKTDKNYAQKLLSAMVFSGVTLALITILETINLGPSKWVSTLFTALPDNSLIFLSPAGSAVILLTYLIPTLIISLMLAVDKKDIVQKSIYFVSSALITSALIIAAFNILPGKPNSPVFAPFSTSWSIAAENIKNPRAFLVGVGPQNYIQAFSLNKGVEFNALDIWNTRFNVARNAPLHIFTTLGLLGLAFWIFLLFTVFRTIKKFSTLSNTARIAIVGASVIVLMTLIIPNNIVLQSAFVFLLATLAIELKNFKLPGSSEFLLKFFAIKRVESENFSFTEETPVLKTELLPLIIGIPSIILALGLLYGTYRVNAADMKFRASLESAAQNNGTQTYNAQKDAIALNPFLSSYHRSYANTNIAIATSISAQGDLSDQSRANITQLIQQAIREGRSAAIINPKNPANWETLAGIYRQLINVADGALDWSTASYTEAIRRDPTNPRLRIELGGIFYQLGDYTTAVSIFEQAVNLKPDWANAHYNLAAAYRENGELQRSVASFENVLILVDPSTTDYARAVEEQNTVKAALGQETTPAQPQTSELQQPAPLPTPLPNEEQIQLPNEDIAPPTPEETGDQPQDNTGFSDITPTPTPTPSPDDEVQPTPTP